MKATGKGRKKKTFLRLHDPQPSPDFRSEMTMKRLWLIMTAAMALAVEGDMVVRGSPQWVRGKKYE